MDKNAIDKAELTMSENVEKDGKLKQYSETDNSKFVLQSHYNKLFLQLVSYTFIPEDINLFRSINRSYFCQIKFKSLSLKG